MQTLSFCLSLVYLQSERDLLDKLRQAYRNERAQSLSLMGVVQCGSMVVKAMGEAGTASPSMELIYFLFTDFHTHKSYESD